MPLYEYQCDACGIKMEKIRKFSDPPLEICEACGGHLQKLFSSPAIQFKGSGFYITDYAKKTAVEGTATTGKPDAGNADKAPAKAESPGGSAGGGTGGSDGGSGPAGSKT